MKQQNSKPDGAVPKGAMPPGERIAKRIARAGICSRREAERLIEAGRVVLNGELIKTPALTVGPDDAITIDGKPLPAAAPAVLWRFHKAAGLITTHRDPRGRPTVFERLPPGLGHVISVGRLDFNSEGLLLLTNDGGLARSLEMPTSGWIRRYRVRVHGRVDKRALASLANGVTVEGTRYGPIEAALDSQTGSNAWLTITLKEGKNREIRRVLTHIDLSVNRLIRTAFGPFRLDNLVRDELEVVAPKILRAQLGKAWRDANRRR